MADIDAAIETAAEGDKALATRRAAAARDLQRRMVRHAGKGSTDMAAAPLRRPASIYTDADRFARETDILFRTLPLVAGLSADMSEPGDRLIFDDAGPPILIVRSKDGKARAFLNMCTHRGSRLVSTCDRAARIACPFHAWTFDLEGWLVGMPGAAGFEDVDRDERALIAVPCEERHGLIFVVPDAGGIMDLDAHLGDFAPVLDLLDLGRAAPVKAGRIEAATNWKFALDTYGESYHFRTLHASTIGRTHLTDVGVFDAYGPHHRVSFPDKSFTGLADMDEADWPAMDYGGVHYLFPNTIIFMGSIEPGKGFVQLFRLFPGDDAGTLATEFTVYAPGGVRSDAHRTECEAAYDATATVVETEDYRIAADGWRSLTHAPSGFEIVLGANEIALQNIHRAIDAAIGL